MIRLITGTPGSGKTYLTVSLLIETYYDKIGDEYILKPSYQGYTIFTNIDNLKLHDVKDLKEIFQVTPFETFFTVAYQEKIHKKYPKCIYVIDEAQRYLSPFLKNKDVIFYFDYHRHFGDEIILITQDFKKISLQINSLVEFEYRSVKQIFHLPGRFCYLLKTGGEIFSRKVVKKNKEIFKLYDSFLDPQGQPLKVGIPFIYKIIIGLVIGMVLIIGWFVYNPPFANATANDIKKTLPGYNHKEKDIIPGKTSNTQNYKSVVPGQIPADLKPDKLKNIRIHEFIKIGSNIHSFRCPITLKLITPMEADYRIFILKESLFASVLESQLKPHETEYAQSDPTHTGLKKKPSREGALLDF